MKKSKLRESRKAAALAAAQAATIVEPVPHAPPTVNATGDERPKPTSAHEITDAAALGELVEAMLRAAEEHAEIAEAMYRAALTRSETAAAVERATAERAAALEARERATAERETVANTRDRVASERDSIANSRDRAAAERGSIAGPRPAAGPDAEAEVRDDAALERARLEAELQRAHLDALTGAFRREMGRLALRNEIERARRGDGKFVIAFIDVDGLKGVNDREGHAAGDRVLRTLAATMRANLRSYDPIVRFGGDEFILGVASVDPGEVQHRIAVMDTSLRNATGVGITAGLATLTSNETLDELTARADAALIEAKRSRTE
jgi:diguanylate cyclase (GGDEF)-like protein